MKKTLKNHFKPFFKTICFCSLCFLIVSLSVFIPKNKTSVNAVYSNEKYYKNQVEFVVMLNEINLVFGIIINFQNKCVNVTALPTESIKNSSVLFDTNRLLSSASSFLNFNPKRKIILNNSDITAIINSAGGINTTTPYGIPSPANPEILIENYGCNHIYGQTVVTLLNLFSYPNAEQLCYSAKLIALTVKQFLIDFSKEKYYILNNSNTDISYTDFYNYRNFLSNCISNTNFNAAKGIWIGEKYYIT